MLLPVLPHLGLFLKEIKEAGFVEVQNFQTVAMYNGFFRKELEETGISYNLEVEIIKKASQLNLFTSPYVFNADEANFMDEAGADALVVYLGPTARKNQRRRAAARLKEAAEKIL